ncbi:hypothetical protein [Reichenbachiella sp.]|uniref:hypothetical protein n=1 Tax=Reichenbachiella sp. TaxID=2184521 RepID=UPI003BB07995
MTDSKLLLLEKEELIESLEIELEEVKEGKADRHIFNHLSNGSDDILAASIHFFRSALQFTLVHTKEQKRPNHTSQVSLFIKYCCLKIHLA